MGCFAELTMTSWMLYIKQKLVKALSSVLQWFLLIKARLPVDFEHEGPDSK